MTTLQRNGRHHYDFWYRGVRYRGSCGAGCKSKTRARQIEAEKRAEVIERGESMQRKAPYLRDFSSRFLEYIAASAELKPQTCRTYRQGWKLLADTAVAKMRLDRIGTPDAAVLTFPGGAGNANLALRTLRRMLSYACEVRALRTAPRIKLRTEEGRERLFAAWEEELILRHCSPALRDILIIMFNCGLRPESEACRLQWADIDWSERRVLIQRGKTKSARRFVGLTAQMAEVFAGCRARNQKSGCAASPFVFPSEAEGGHLAYISQSWANALERSNAELAGKVLPPLAPGLVPYSARHTYATRYLLPKESGGLGGDVGQLMRLMGHTNIATTMRYVHLIEASASARVMDTYNEKKLSIVRKRA